MRIVVLMGGTSSERDVSLASGLRIAAALRTKGHDVVAVDTVRGTLAPAEEQALLAGGVMRTLPPDRTQLALLSATTLPSAVRELQNTGGAEVVFLALHGGQGEDGTVQALLDLTRVPYTGSGHLASALAMDKDLSKRLFRDAGVLTPDWQMLRAGDGVDWSAAPFLSAAAQSLGIPLIVKPSKEGSTVGLSLVKNEVDLPAAIQEAFRHDTEVMLERFIPGRELTVGVLGDQPLPVGEIIPKHELYDYECKYTPGMAVEVFPAAISDAERLKVQDAALRAFRALKLTGYARIDFRMTAGGEFHCLEANTLPGMTELSLIPQAAAAAGISFPELCERIVALSMPQHATGVSG
ncbi:MAG: D-alanine--D-alanine ligase [Gemmatimonadetes bacterium]|nr:D-alanine--D-alanine ligase [Gemmatimonadota bacterium]